MRVDIQIELITLLEGSGAGNAAVEEVGEPEEVVLFADGPVEVDAAVGVGTAGSGGFRVFFFELLFGLFGGGGAGA